MRILYTQRKLTDFAGTEMVTLDLARSMKKRGHEVAVYCPRPGKIGDLLAANGVPTVSQLSDVPWTPDFIHCHHQLPAIAALTAFTDTPALYVCHGARPWVEHPPLHPQIQTYIAVSQKLAAYIATKHNLSDSRIRTISNFVDMQRFNVVRKQSSNANRKAVLFGQYLRDEDVKLLEKACARNDIQLDKIGPAYNNLRPNPELFLPDYDFAFAVGRSALEAMACGCAVIPIMSLLAGQLVTTGNFNEWSEKNFSPRFFTEADRISDTWLADQLATYNPGETAKVTEKVREEYSLEKAVDKFEALYKELATKPPLGNTQQALALHLEKLAKEVDENWDELLSVSAECNAKDNTIQLQNSAISHAKNKIRSILERGVLNTRAEPALSSLGNWRKILEESGLFDSSWYLDNYPDVAKSGQDPLIHYLSHGIFENRDASPSNPGSSLLSRPQVSENLGSSALEQLVLQMMIFSHHIPLNQNASSSSGDEKNIE